MENEDLPSSYNLRPGTYEHRINMTSNNPTPETFPSALASSSSSNLSPSNAPAFTPTPTPTPTTSADEFISNLPNPTAIETLVTEFPTELGNKIDPKYVDSQTNAWYPLLEKFVSTLSDECLRHSSMHAESSKLYNKRFQYITLSLIIVPLISGFLALVPLSSLINKIFQGVLALILTALGAINKMMKFSEKSHLHRLASNKYMKLNGQIAEQLFLPIDKRYNGIYFERWCRGIFFSIKEFAPYPDKRFAKQIQTKIPETPQVPSPSQPSPTGIPAPQQPLPTDEEGQPPTESIPLETFPERAREEAYRKYLQGRGRRLGVFMGEHDSPII
jgi:hypothetical protein